MARLVEHARAKINLDLRIIGRRADGYHELDSIVTFADLADRLELEPAADLSLQLSGPAAPGLVDELDNLVLQAARLMAEQTGREGARIILDKQIPVAAGLGGGSADAAATLRGLNRLWQAGLDSHELEELGRALGADVAVCVRSCSARMRGIGERLDPVAGLGRLHLLLVNPGVATPTGPVFRALAAPLLTAGPEPVWASDDPAGRWRERGRNDLEPPAAALAPAVAEVLDALRAMEDVQLVRMSGSGATCFGLFERAAACAKAARSLVRVHPGWWVRPVLAGEP